MRRRSLLLRSCLAVAAAVVVNVLLTVVSRDHDVVAVTLAVICLVALAGALLDGSASLVPARWRVGQLVEEPLPRTESTLARYRRMLEHHWAARRADTDLQRRLLALAEHRLAQVHGLTRDADPDLVRHHLGPELAMLEDPEPRRLSPAQINRIIDRIEEL